MVLIIFVLVVVGIVRMYDIYEVGCVGVKVVIYFEIVFIFVFGIGLFVVNVFKLGYGMNIDFVYLDSGVIKVYMLVV